MPYNVYLHEVGISGLTPDIRNTVITKMTRWFNLVVDHHPYRTAVVQWARSRPPIQDHELLVYFCQSQMNSVIRARLAGGASGNEDGLTVFPDGNHASEVYVFGANGNSPLDSVAELAFHECMHNKLRLNDHQLHPRPGLAARAVGAHTPIHAQNISQMRAALSNPQPQWLGGYDGDALEGL